MKKTHHSPKEQRSVVAELTKSAIETIQTQLECLKYVGTRNGEVPTGQGMPLSILLLPDLVFDFRPYAMRREDHVSEGKVCAVGGRAARIACNLLHLQDENDATYRVHLMTRTGNLGRLLLADEFTLRGSKRPARHLDLDTILVHEDQPRCALLMDPRNITAEDPDPEQELKRACLREGRAPKLMADVKTICLTSISTPHFVPLLEEILDYADHPGRLLYIDTTRAHDTNFETLIAQLKKRRDATSGGRAAKLVLFLPAPDAHELWKKAQVGSSSELCGRFDVGIVEYGTSVTYYAPAGGHTTTQPGIDFAVEDVPERFKAGVLLASTLFESLGDVNLANVPNLRRALLAQWPTDEWEWILAYGMAVARTNPGEDLQRQVLSACGVDSPHLPTSDFQPLRGVTVKMPGESFRRLRLDEGTCADLARLAGHRRRNSLTPARELCRDLSICSPTSPRCDAGCAKRRLSPVQAPSAAILLDLDSTLMDSTEQRKMALLPALESLIKKGAVSRFETAEEAADFFTEHVYKLWPLYAHMEMGDYRQIWNQQGWYASFIALANAPEMAEQIRAFWRSRPAGVNEQEQARRVCGHPSWTQFWNGFQRSYRQVLQDNSDQIRAARSVFEEVPLQPSKEARDLLRSLELTGSFSLYVVSEGDPETQWLKIKNAGLDAFFKRQSVLTTGEAAAPIEEMARVGEERSRLERELAEKQTKVEALRRKLQDLAGIKGYITSMIPPEAGAAHVVEEGFGPHLWPLPQEIKDLEAHIRRVKLQFDAVKFVGLVLKRMAKKGGRAFYAAVIRAILRNPESPRDELRSFAHLIDGRLKKAELKFAMIGDRLDNDIEPPSLVLGPEHIATVHLRSGTYAGPDRTVARGVPPRYVADTLAQVKAILLDKETWDGLPCKGDPQVFDWAVNFNERLQVRDGSGDYSVGVDLLLQGIRHATDPRSIVSRICAGILAERLGQHPEEFEGVLNACAELDADSEETRVGTNALVLCGLVNAGLGDVAELAEKIRQRLGKFETDLQAYAPRTDEVLAKLKQAAAKLPLEYKEQHV